MDIKTKMFDINLVAIHKINTTLTLDKPAYVKMCILELTKGLVHESHFDYIKIKYENKRDYYSQILPAWSMKLKLKMFMTNLLRKT